MSFYFSFRKGKPIAQIISGTNKGKIIHLKEDNEDEEKVKEKCCEKCDAKCGARKRKCCNKCEVKSGGCYVDEEFFEEFNKIFKDEIKRIKKNKLETIDLKGDGKISPIPNLPKKKNKGDKEIEHLFVSGPTGSGKSTFAAMYIKMYKKLFPKHKFYVFSDVAKDKVIDDLKPSRVKLNNQMYEDPLDVKDFKNSIVLFDDVDSVKDKRIREAALDLRDRILKTGRHYGTSAISIAHNPTNNKDTKQSLLESSAIVLFPHGGDEYRVKKVLEVYCGIDPKKIKSIMDLKSRWICIYKHYPKYILHESGAFLVR